MLRAGDYAGRLLSVLEGEGLAIGAGGLAGLRAACESSQARLLAPYKRRALMACHRSRVFALREPLSNNLSTLKHGEVVEHVAGASRPVNADMDRTTVVVAYHGTFDAVCPQGRRTLYTGKSHLPQSSAHRFEQGCFRGQGVRLHLAMHLALR